jgi:hypothetical protein
MPNLKITHYLLVFGIIMIIFNICVQDIPFIIAWLIIAALCVLDIFDVLNFG